MAGWLARSVAEFVGTFLLVFTVGSNVLCASPVWAPVSIGLVLMVSIYALASVSGANFNPAVSLALGLCGKMKYYEVAGYCCVQAMGGVMAGLTYRAMFAKTFALAPSVGFGWKEAMLAETIYTFMLCFVVLNVAASRINAPPGNEFFGVAIGFVIIAGAYGAGSISGGAFNPAVALGIDLSSATLKWSLAYMPFEALGAVLAALLFRFVRIDEYGGDLSEGDKYPLTPRLASEFVGTYMLVLTVGLNILGNSPAPAFSIAASLTSMVYALGDVSGAHFNPAVTLSIILSGRDKCDTKDGILYVLTQVCAGMIAALTYSAMHGGATTPLQPGAGYGWSAVATAEVVFTFVLCYVVLAVATTEQSHSTMFGLAIGACITVGGSAIGAISGGSLNPAVSIGISSSDTMISHGIFFYCFAYTLFELMGGAAAAGLFRVTHAFEFPKSAARLRHHGRSD